MVGGSACRPRRVGHVAAGAAATVYGYHAGYFTDIFRKCCAWYEVCTTRTLHSKNTNFITARYFLLGTLNKRNDITGTRGQGGYFIVINSFFGQFWVLENVFLHRNVENLDDEILSKL